MKITKFGHCCLLIEIAGKRVLTDPGAFSVGHEHLSEVDIILITHEHADHCHTESILALVETNPGVTIISNSSVARLLKEKFDNDGQTINTHLDGLYHSKYVNYWEYVHLDTLLTLQTPKTDFPDELVFITYHQITELYFKLILL